MDWSDPASLAGLKTLMRQSRTYAGEYVEFRARVSQRTKDFEDDRISYERLAKSFAQLDLTDLPAWLDKRKQSLSEDVELLKKIEDDLQGMLTASKGVMQPLLDMYREIDMAVNENTGGTQDTFLVEMSKLVYDDVKDRVLCDNHQIRADPPIYGVYKDEHRRGIFYSDPSCEPASITASIAASKQQSPPVSVA